jgi:tripeptide aminopeptidase
MEKIIDKFLRYVSIDTQSNENSESQPSSDKQLKLLGLLKDELVSMGVEAELDEYGYVMGKIPSNCPEKEIPAIGFIAHVDTSPDASGADIKPQIIENYEGGDIALKGVEGLFLKPSEFPELLDYKGQTLICTDGTTLLGADDKAGIAEIMCAVEYIVNHPEFKHGPICIAFTPDEEIGRGVVKFDVEKFGAQYGYTMDGGAIGELEFENFNAAAATINIQGRNVHPGYAKGKMKNAIRIMMELDSLLPAGEKPELTEGYEGFFHVIAAEGSVENASSTYIIRDHSLEKYEEKKALMQACVDQINQKYGEGTATVNIRHQYYNMRSKVEPHYFIVEKAMEAMKIEGIEPKIQPIRGGTDGARLSFMGLPCPNLGTGGFGFHGPYEHITAEGMELCVEMMRKIVEKYAKA